MTASPIAREIARMPGVPERILARHVDVGGRCGGCTTPGTGTPAAPWPCALHRLATEAMRRRG